MRVYTSIYGAYDPLWPHPDNAHVDEWVCYTDNPELHGDGWRVVYEEPRFPHPRLSAKWRKCHPPRGDTLWIDGSVAMHNPEMIDTVAACLDEGRMTMFRHPDRTCIFPEVDASIGMAKYAGLEQRMVEQVNHYRLHGWKENAGLWASTVIGRRGDDPAIIAMGAAWFAHCELYTYQDQLSLPYLLDRYGIEPVPLPYSLRENPWFGWMGHAHHG